jgi:hypothetical protein
MAQNEVAAQVDPNLWQRLAPENANDVVICNVCSTLVYNKSSSMARHEGWHERLIPGSTTQGG